MRLLIRLAGLGAAALALACVVVVAAGVSERAAPADLGVVLGAHVERGGVPSRRLAERCERAAEVYRAGLVRVLMVSGGGRRHDQAPAMRTWLIAHGVPDSAIVVDRWGSNTWLTAIHARAWLRAHGRHSVLAISQYYHLPRCRLSFARLGVAPVACTYPLYVERLDLLAIPREVAALVKYALRPLPRAGRRLNPGGAAARPAPPSTAGSRPPAAASG